MGLSRTGCWAAALGEEGALPDQAGSAYPDHAHHFLALLRAARPDRHLAAYGPRRPPSTDEETARQAAERERRIPGCASVVT